jgi:hypothetical protein
VFTAEKPHQGAIFLQRPSHDDNSWGVLLKDKNLKKFGKEGEFAVESFSELAPG